MAFLRAVNVGGTQKLPMSELVKMCNDLGCNNVKTYIASGNVVFKTTKAAPQIKDDIEDKLLDFFKKPVGVIIRNQMQMEQLLDDNPFKTCAPNRVIASLIDEVPNDIMQGVKNHNDEEIIQKPSAIFIHYGDGMASSKLQLPWFKVSTGRNINTITKIIQILSQI